MFVVFYSKYVCTEKLAVEEQAGQGNRRRNAIINILSAVFRYCRRRLTSRKIEFQYFVVDTLTGKARKSFMNFEVGECVDCRATKTGRK